MLRCWSWWKMNLMISSKVDFPVITIWTCGCAWKASVHPGALHTSEQQKGSWSKRYLLSLFKTSGENVEQTVMKKTIKWRKSRELIWRYWIDRTLLNSVERRCKLKLLFSETEAKVHTIMFISNVASTWKAKLCDIFAERRMRVRFPFSPFPTISFLSQENLYFITSSKKVETIFFYKFWGQISVLTTS